MNITKEVLITGTGCTPGVADVWLPFVQQACDKFSINTAGRIAAFLANVGVESGGLVLLVENLNYSAEGLTRTWPSRYAVPDSKLPNALALAIARNPQAIANNTYAYRLGNGDIDSGDGWAYRGQGPIQITGKDNITRCLAAIGMAGSDPSVLQKPEAGSLSAAWFFSSKGCNQLADTGQISAIVRVINGTIPCVANQGQTRIARYRSALQLFS